MKATFQYEARDFEITTEHTASRYDRPVLLVDGEVTNVPVHFADDGDATDISGDATVGWPD